MAATSKASVKSRPAPEPLGLTRSVHARARCMPERARHEAQPRSLADTLNPAHRRGRQVGDRRRDDLLSSLSWVQVPGVQCSTKVQQPPPSSTNRQRPPAALRAVSKLSAIGAPRIRIEGHKVSNNGRRSVSTTLDSHGQ
jgi:hypothetical protein